MTGIPEAGGAHDAGHDSRAPRAAPAWRRIIAGLGTPGGLFLTAAILASGVPTISAIRDPDFWWHLRAGQLILDRHGLLGTDPFTFTAAGHRWTMHEWLSEVIFALLHAAGGLALVVGVLCALTWLGLIGIFLRARLRHPGYLPLGAGLILASVTGYPIWGPRAQMITFALSCLVLLLAERHLLRGGRDLWLLVPVFLVWSNLHSGFIIGLGFLVLIAGGEIAGRTLRLPADAPASRLRPLLLVLAACAAVTIVNPNGPAILLYPFATQGSTAQQSVIQEWHSPNFHMPEVIGFEVMLLSLVALAVVNRRMRARDIALVTATALLALQSVRHIALFVAAATPAWIEQADLALARRGRGRGLSPRAAAPPALRAAAAVAVVLAIGGDITVKLATALSTREDSPSYAAEYPVCASRWLARAPAGLRIFNQYGEGGYLAYRLSARGDRVFIFGDAALMGDPLLDDYSDVESLKPRWSSVLRTSGVDVALFDAAAPLTTVLEASPDWILVYRDSLNEAFVPTDHLATLRLPPPPDAPSPAGECPPAPAPGRDPFPGGHAGG